MPSNWETYAPYLIIFIAFATTYKVFVTPTQMNDKISDLETKLENKFASKEIVNSLSKNFEDVKKKIDKIYEYILAGKLKND